MERKEKVILRRATAPFLERSLAFYHHDRINKKLKAFLALAPHIARITSGLPVANLIKSIPKLLKK